MITISGARPSAKPAVDERNRKSRAKKPTTGRPARSAMTVETSAALRK